MDVILKHGSLRYGYIRYSAGDVLTITDAFYVAHPHRFIQIPKPEVKAKVKVKARAKKKEPAEKGQEQGSTDEVI